MAEGTVVARFESATLTDGGQLMLVWRLDEEGIDKEFSGYHRAVIGIDETLVPDPITSMTIEVDELPGVAELKATARGESSAG